MNEVLDANGTTCLEFVVSQPPVLTMPGFYLKFQPAQGLSGYSGLQFSAKCADTGSSVTFSLYMIKNVEESGYKETVSPLTAQNAWISCGSVLSV
jgi:hypothetical protein